MRHGKILWFAYLKLYLDHSSSSPADLPKAPASPSPASPAPATPGCPAYLLKGQEVLQVQLSYRRRERRTKRRLGVADGVAEDGSFWVIYGRVVFCGFFWGSGWV